MEREEYLKERKRKKKDLIKQLINMFFMYDGDYKILAEKIEKSKSTVSTLLNSDELINEMIKDGELTKDKVNMIKAKIEENKQLGRRKGGDNFKKNYDVEFNNEHRIVSHNKR